MSEPKLNVQMAHNENQMGSPSGETNLLGVVTDRKNLDCASDDARRQRQ